MITVGLMLADRYEIVSRVGTGGMSDVYKAKDHVLGRFVAIKVLKQEFAGDRTFVSKFRAEAQSAAGLEHPNIVNVYDVGNESGTYYIVMEYVEGITLKTYISKKGKISFKEAVSIAIQVARGIEAAHNKEIIHRDIKPQNIIISTEGKVKVTDFGIARAASANTISSDVMGSVHYASPEQARNGYVDNRSDIYSMGIVMYEMITGRVPFDGESTVAVALQHLQEEMVPPSRYTPEIPISFEKIIAKCTQKSPERRYQNVQELILDLRRSLVEPDKDFVYIPPLFDSGRTRVIPEAELKEIKEHSAARNDASMAAIGYRTDKQPEEDDEEDDEAGLNPRMEKMVTVLSIITFIAIVLVIIYMLGTFFGLFKFSLNNKTTEPDTVIETESESEEETTVEMIDIVGEDVDDARAKLEDLGLHLYVQSVEESDQEPGIILSQEIGRGSIVDKGTTINVVISGEKEKAESVEVPNLVDYGENAAVAALTAKGLQASKTFVYSDTEAGIVISMSPEAGTTVERGSTVTLTISQGKKSTTVPNVIGYTESNAKTMLTNAGLTVVVTSEYSDSVEEGSVISQRYAGKTVEEGTEITICVSLGPEPVQEETPAETPGNTGTDNGADPAGSTTGTDQGSDSTSGQDTGSDGSDASATTPDGSAEGQTP